MSSQSRFYRRRSRTASAGIVAAGDLAKNVCARPLCACASAVISYIPSEASGVQENISEATVVLGKAVAHLTKIPPRVL